MAGYHIIHVENKWIVCFEQARLISFARKWQALKTMHTAARLIEAPNSRRANVLASPQRSCERCDPIVAAPVLRITGAG